MKVSFNWLRELVALPPEAGVDEVARRLTLAGLEVESIERRGRDVTGVRVAEVRGMKPHPGADKLRVVRVSVGAGQPEEDVVCGAPNVPAPGGRVAWAPPGATLPGGFTLARKDVRGVSSPGMLCSEKELGVGDGVDGILILSIAAPIGADVASYLEIVDDVLEVNVTPNRPDALSHLGVAREVAAAFGVTCALPDVTALVARGGAGEKAASATAASQASPRGVEVSIADSTACPRYVATIVAGVHTTASPLWMRMRLAACGVRAISNLVDVTNYVMLEMGHPLHAFDLGRVEGGIVVRRAEVGETMRTLDDVERKLEPGDVVIADGRGPVALAGVMGGQRAEVSDATRNVLLEAATFDPIAIRRTAKRLGMHSEASHRFERGVDAASVGEAGERAAALLAALGGGSVVQPAVDCYVAAAPRREVMLSAGTLRRVVGLDIPTDLAATKLRAAGMNVEALASGDLRVGVPTYRFDVSIEEDLVEEVMRLVGYDEVPTRLPAGGRAPDPSPERLADLARDRLAALGAHEVATWAFVPRAALAALRTPELAQAITVKNPISADYEVMRTSLAPGLLQTLARNLARGNRDVALFEVGPIVRVADGEERHHDQSTHAAAIFHGRQAGWLKPGDPLDFFDAKQAVVELLAGLCVDNPTFDPLGANDAAAHAYLHPGVSAVIRERGVAHELGVLGEIHPTVARRLEVEGTALYFQVDLDRLGEGARKVRIAATPRFPAVTRDISFWIDDATPAEAQRQAMRGAGEPLVRHIAVLEDFRDPRYAPAGKKGMLWTVTYRADDRTLTDAEADAAHAKVLGALQAAFPIQIR